MARRLFQDNDAWEDIARRLSNEINILCKDVLCRLESEMGERVDLRDFSFVANSSIDSFVADLLIRRRLGNPDAMPPCVIDSYPRLQKDEDWDDTLSVSEEG